MTLICENNNHLCVIVQHAATYSPLEEPQVVLGWWQTAECKVLGSNEGVAIVTAIRIDTVAKAKGIAAASGQGATSGRCVGFTVGAARKWLPTGAGSLSA